MLLGDGVSCDDALVKVLLDGNVIDFLADDLEARKIVEDALARGRLTLIQTHILRDELNQIPNAKKRARLKPIRALLGGESVPTVGFVLGFSRLGAAALADDETNETLGALMGDNPRQVADSLLITTAKANEAILVTNDRQARRRARRQGVDALSPEAWMSALAARAPDAHPCPSTAGCA
jgi:rRNA-processing protein FCF1